MSSFVRKLRRKKRTNVRILPKKWQKYLEKTLGYVIIRAVKQSASAGVLSVFARTRKRASVVRATGQREVGASAGVLSVFARTCKRASVVRATGQREVGASVGGIRLRAASLRKKLDYVKNKRGKRRPPSV